MPDDLKTDILVVDDLADNLLVYQCVLEELGQNVVMARSGEEALKFLLQREFAVILLDVNMPGMDGFETAALIRQRKKSARAPIIFLTAFSDELPPSRAYASGAVDYISTPIVPEILRAKVRVFVELYQLRQQTAIQAEERVRRTVAEEAARRSAFLAEAGGSLASTLDFETTLSALTSISIPFLADLSVACIVEPSANVAGTRKPGPKDGLECRAAGDAGALDTAAGQLNEWSAVTWSWLGADGPRAASAAPPPALLERIGCVLQHGKPIHWQHPISVPLPEGERPPTVPPADHFAPGHAASNRNGQPLAPEELTVTSAKLALSDVLLLPLFVRGVARGVLCLGRSPRRSGFTSDEVSLAHDLAARGGMAIENTLLVRSIQEADRRKDEFLAMLAHELRNPLAPIRNAVHLLKLLGPVHPDLQQARDLIDRQVTHLVRLVDDLLDATRIARCKVHLRKERCDVTDVVRQAIEDYRPLFAAHELRLETDIPAGPAWVDGDPTRLTQVVSNLLSNAQKFTEPGGEVHVRVTPEEEGRMIALRIRDSGIGIDPKMLPNIFGVFVQADRSLERVRGGLGLGLALVKGLVELHGGDVLATSAGLNRGAEFVIRLPVSLQTSMGEQPTNANDKSARPTVGHRVLLVEDNRDAAHTAARLLQMAGHDVRTAHVGSAALEIARSFHPDVILCDIGLPGGMSGYDVARAVRQDPELSSTYLVALTGYGRDEDRRESEEAGFDLHLTKPVDCEKLEGLLGNLVQSAQ